MATYTYIIPAIKSAWLNKDAPNTNYSTETVVNTAGYLEHPLLIGFDSNVYKNEIKGKILKGLKLKIYIVANGSASQEYSYSYIGRLDDFTENEVTYNDWHSGNATSEKEIFNNVFRIDEWPKYVTLGRGMLGDATFAKLEEAIGATAISFSGGSTSVAQIETTRGAHPPQLVVEAEDSYPICTPQKPKDNYVDAGADNTFTWKYNNENEDTQKKYEIQIKDTLKDWTTVANGASSATSVIIPAGSFATGNVSWRVRATSQYDIVGEWSEEASFIAQGAPQKPSLSVTTSPRPKMNWVSSEQHAYRVMVDGVKVAQAYGTQKEYTVKEYLDDGTHILGVSVQNEFGLWSEWATDQINVVNVPGAEITLFATGGEKATLAWTETTHKAYYIYRDDIPIAKTAGHTYTDQMAIGPHVYKVRGVIDDNYSMSNEVTVTLSVDAPEMAALDDMQWLKLKYSAAQNSPLGVSEYQDVAYQFYAGHRYPVAETSQQITKVYSFNVAFDDMSQSMAFEKMLGKTVVYKDQRGRLFTGPLMAYELSAEQFFSAYSCSIQQTNNMERIQYD